MTTKKEDKIYLKCLYKVLQENITQFSTYVVKSIFEKLKLI